MANFPTSLDTFTNPSSGNTLDSPSHSLQHSDANDAIEAIEAKLGVGASPADSATSGYVLTAGTGGTTTWQARSLQYIETQTFSAVSSVDFSNDVFTSSYDTYLLNIYATASTGARISWRGRTSGSTISTSNYTYQQMVFNNTTVSGSRTSGDSKGKIAYIDTANPSGLSLTIYQPKNSTKTYYRSVGISTYTDAYIEDYAGTFTLTNSFDSIQISIESGNFTGKAVLYGYRQ